MINDDCEKSEMAFVMWKVNLITKHSSLNKSLSPSLVLGLRCASGHTSMKKCTTTQEMIFQPIDIACLHSFFLIGGEKFICCINCRMLLATLFSLQRSVFAKMNGIATISHTSTYSIENLFHRNVGMLITVSGFLVKCCG